MKNKKEREKQIGVSIKKYIIAAVIFSIIGIPVELYFRKLNQLTLRNEIIQRIEKPVKIENEEIQDIEKISIEKKLAEGNQKSDKQISNNQIRFKTSVVTGTIVNNESENTASQAKSGISINQNVAFGQKNMDISDKEEDGAPLNRENNNIDEGENLKKNRDIVSVKTDDIITVSDSDAGLRLDRALKIMKLGDTLTAMGQMRDIAKGNRKYVAVWHHLTIGYLAQHDKSNAIKSLNKLLKLSNSDRIKKKINEVLKLSKDDRLDEALKKLKALKPDEY